MVTDTEAKAALDKIINKSRIHQYKPIQIAEILYHHRTDGGFDPLNVESYRNSSKIWRDHVTKSLMGRVSTSSQKFQDNLFEDNAVPPTIIQKLIEINEATNGGVEAYIYANVENKFTQLMTALDYVESTPYDQIDVSNIVDKFYKVPGLKRSVDKIYEIVVYSLFETLVEVLEAKVTVTINPSKKGIVDRFSDFVTIVMGIEEESLCSVDDAMFFRVGVTNAADRGLDMWANFGPAIQVKHLSLKLDVATDVADNIDSNRIVIVCESCDKNTIELIVSQLGLKIRGIIVEEILFRWYDEALRGEYSKVMGPKIKKHLVEGINEEFPSLNGIEPFMRKREYTKVKFPKGWGVGQMTLSKLGDKF